MSSQDNKKEQKKQNDSELTDRELENLRQQNIHGDGGDDQQLRDRKRKVDFTGEDLDVPQPEPTKKKTEKDLKDEENELYSEGGDRNENLERDDSAK